MQEIKEVQTINKNIAGKIGMGSAILILFGLIVITIILGTMIGVINLEPSFVINTLLYKIFGIGDGDTYSGSLASIVWDHRTPRILLAIFIGVALSVSGVVMQSIVKNPLANPFTLGISSGASLGATIAIIMGLGGILGSNTIGIFAFLGSFTVSVLVIKLSNTGGKSNSIRLLLAGMAISALCSSISSFVIYMGATEEGMMNVTFWLMGSMTRADFNMLKLIIPSVVVITAFFITQYRTLNLMLLGDDAALTLGKNLHYYRIGYLLLTSVLVGLSVYAAGIIGFVGLIIPHIVRSFTGTDHKKLVIFSALSGAIYLGAADIISRVIVPNAELPIGIITSLVGAPFFIYMLVKKSYNFGAN